MNINDFIGALIIVLFLVPTLYILHLEYNKKDYNHVLMEMRKRGE